VLLDGYTVRLVGQDSRRGTFGQRHAVIVDRHTGAEYIPLRQFNSATARFHVYDSLLSEFAAVGFEYGYRRQAGRLVCWEAQFGDFINGAQTIVDEFISSGEQKWGQRSGVVLLLRTATRVRGPTTPRPAPSGSSALRAGQHDRGDAHHPGQLLPPAPLAGTVAAGEAADRVHPQVDTAAEDRDLADSGLHHGLLPAGARQAASRGRCRGTHGAALRRQDLLRPGSKAAGRRAVGDRDRAVERLYPLPADELLAELSRYPDATEVRWVQEEPANMGGWPYMALRLPELLRRPIRLVSIPASSAPAGGSARAHAAEHAGLIDAALRRDR